MKNRSLVFFALLDLETGKRIIPNITIASNSWGDPSCNRIDGQQYGPHGIDLVERNDGKLQLGVVSHYPDETIEMFELIQLYLDIYRHDLHR